MTDKQVDRSHYDFARYLGKGRWASVWHQLDEVLRLARGPVLELGPGPGLFKALGTHLGLHIETVDLDPELRPDHVASALALPFADGAYDTACAFQVLEHLPYDEALAAFAELRRVARGHVVISLPDARGAWRYVVHVPRVGAVERLFERPVLGLREHRFDGEHHWEVNTRGHGLERVLADFSLGCELLKTYRVPEMPYHRFFVFRRA